MANLGVTLPGLEMANPLMLASGIQGGNAAALHRVAATACGGLVSKSIGPEPREMYPGPVCVEAADSVVLNAMGLPNPGADVFAELLQTETFSKPMLISIFGGDAEEYAMVAQKLVAAGAESLELNLSCPHAKPGSRALIIGQQPDLIHGVVSAVRDAVDVPLYAKLSPNTTSIVADATAAFKGGADGPDAAEVERLIEARKTAKKEKDFATADKIRDDLAAKGIQLKDGKDPDTGERVTTWELKR